MVSDEIDSLDCYGGTSLVDVPPSVADDENLHRRVHPTFIKFDGSVSSQAFTDPEMSVDRAEYRSLDETLDGYPQHGCATVETGFARSLHQEVVAVPELLNPAHAHVNGKKTKSIAKELARGCTRVK